jgi:hypothetical protein
LDDEGLILEAILLAAFLGLAALVYALAPQMAQLLLGAIGGEQGAYFFLVELPVANATATGTIGPAIVNVYDLMQSISFVLFAVVLVVAGLCYALESFRVMGEGTAANIITGSFFTLIMVFLVVPFYNVVADLFNYLTDPNSNLILEPGMIQAVIGAAMRPPGGFTDQIVSFFMAVFFLVMVAVSLIAVGILGTLRIFFVGACLAIMPLLLVLRLIPLTKRISESFIEMLIGLTIASLMSAVFLRFGYEVVSTGGFTGLMATIAAIGTLIAAAMIPTVLAPRLGSLFMTTAGVATAAVSTAAVGTVAVAGGIAAGGALGLRHGLQAAGAIGAMGRGARAKLAAQGFLTGAGAGLKTGLSSALSGRMTTSIPGLGTVPSFPGVAETLAAETGTAHLSLHDLMDERVGSFTDGLLIHSATANVSPLATDEQGEFLKNQIAGMSDEAAGNMLLENFPELKVQNRGKVGGEFKRLVAAMSPLAVSSMWARIKEASATEEARTGVYTHVFENHMKDREKLLAKGLPEPKLSELDKSPYFAIDIFNTGSVSNKGRIINAKLFKGILTRYNPNLPSKDGEDLFAKRFRRKSPRKVAEILAEIVDMELTSREAEMYGPAAKKMIETIAKNNPMILSNLAQKMKSAGWKGMMTSPRFVERAMKDVEEQRLQAQLATEYMKGVLLVRKAPKEKLPEVSLKWLFPEEPKTATSPQQAEVDLGKFFKLIDREIVPRTAPSRGLGYTPPKPRKKGEIIARGFGGDVAGQLEKWRSGKLNRKRKKVD